jgi:ABC-type branched-subunit amino acid transport system substrate-binding protein
MFKLRSVIVAAMVVAGAVLLAACGSSSSSSSSSSGGTNTSSGSPFVDLVSVDQTGPTKVYGLPELAAIQAAAKVINEKGGILGHKVVVKSINDNGNPQTGTSELIKYLSSNPKPNNFYPGAESTLEGALIPVAARHGLLMCAKGDGEELFGPGKVKGYPLGFSVQGTVPPLNEAIAEFFKKKGIKKVGILAGEYAYAEGEIPIITKALDKQGIQHTVVKASLTATSLTPQVDQLKSNGAEAIYAALVGASSGYAFAARAQLGWDVPLVGEGSFSGTDLTKTVPAAQLKNAYITLYPDAVTTTNVPGIATMKEVMGVDALEKFGVPIDVLGDGWDTLVVCKDGAEKAKSIEPEKIAKALESSGEFTDPLMTEYKSVKYSPEDHENFAPKPSDFPIVPVGPFKAGQVTPAK